MAIDLLVIPTKDSSSNAWIEWHKGLKSRFGRAEANITFEMAWLKNGNDAANETNLREYLKSQKYDLEANFTDELFDFIQIPFETSRIIGWITVILVIIIILAIVYAFLRNPERTTKVVMAGATKNPGFLM